MQETYAVMSAKPSIWSLPLAMLLGCALGNPALAACGVPTGTSLNDKVGSTVFKRELRKLGPALVFTSGLRVNTDGASNSYHPGGTAKGALNTICNGIAITPKTGPHAGQKIVARTPTSISGKERCRLMRDAVARSEAQDFAPLADTKIDWFALAVEPNGPREGRPCIQKSGEHAGFFVAQTAFAADPAKTVCDPAHWVSATAIPYVTRPGSQLTPHGVKKGDLALVHRRVAGQDRVIVALVADSGPGTEVGEGSVALHTALGSLPQSGKPIPGTLSGGVTTIIFPGRRAKQPVNKASLEAERAGLLSAVGGEAAVTSCAPG